MSWRSRLRKSLKRISAHHDSQGNSAYRAAGRRGTASFLLFLSWTAKAPRACRCHWHSSRLSCAGCRTGLTCRTEGRNRLRGHIARTVPFYRLPL